MNRVVGGIQVQHYVLRLPLLGLNVELYRQTVRGLLLHHGLLVTCRFIGLLRCQLQTVEGAVVGAWIASTPLPPPPGPIQIRLAGQHCQQRIPPQLIMIIEILVAQHQRIHTLSDQLPHCLFYSLGSPVIGEAHRRLPAEAIPSAPTPASLLPNEGGKDQSI